MNLVLFINITLEIKEILHHRRTKNTERIKEYFEISALGNWENKNILVEKSKPPKVIIETLYISSYFFIFSRAEKPVTSKTIREA